MADAHKFKTVTLEAEHVPEVHRTLGTDGTVTEDNLPGSVHVYLVVDGARVPFTTYKAGKVFDAIDAHKANAKSRAASSADDNE